MGPRFATSIVEETVAGLRFELEMVADFDEVLEHYVETTPDQAERIPYYAHLWPAARALVTWMAAHPALWPGQRVLELGCGLGLPAMTAAKLGAEVFASDFHPDNGAFLRRNAARNGVPLHVFTMDWNRPALRCRFDTILGSDLLYESAMVEPLFQGVTRLLTPTGRLILADPGRPDLERAVDYAKSLGFAADLHAEEEGFIVSFSRP
jgi:predicted nicotinamide N-methyase